LESSKKHKIHKWRHLVISGPTHCHSCRCIDFSGISPSHQVSFLFCPPVISSQLYLAVDEYLSSWYSGQFA